MEINWLGFILAVLTPTIVGFIYYNQAVMGRQWMASIGMTEEKAKEANMAVVFGVSFVMSVLISFFMLGFCNGPGQDVPEFDTFRHGAAHGLIVSVFLLIPTMITNGLYEQRSWKNMLITGSYWVITLALMGGILDHFHHWGA